MASLLESLESQYAAVTGEIASKIALISTFTGVEKKMKISQVEKQLEEAREVLEQMDLEVKGMPPATREKNLLPHRMKNYTSQLTDLEKELKKARISIHNDDAIREAFFEGDIREEQRQCLLDNTEKLERASRQLESGYRVALETEQLGAEVLSDLHSQRETITRNRERLRETNYDIGKSSRLVTGMIRGLLQQKMVLGVVSIVIAISVIVGIYFLIAKS